MPDNVKICPECGAEYDPRGDVCADCGIVLVFKTHAIDPRDELPESDDLVCIRTDLMNSIDAMRKLLGRKGVATRVELHEKSPVGVHRNTYGLLVRPDDVERAKEIYRADWLGGAPEQARTFEYAEQELSGVCPACDTRIPEGRVECPECGLVVGHVEEEVVEICPRCETEVAADATRCPGCGAEFA